MKNFYVINYDFNRQEFYPYDVIPYLINEYNKLQNKPKTFEDIKEFIIKESKYMWWGRCEYEIILKDWPSQTTSEKWDVYKQVMMNIDIITNILIDNISIK